MSDIEYFELKYLEEINELFLHLKEITRASNLMLFHRKNDNYLDLYDFICSSVEVVEENTEDEEKDTFNDEEYYSMLQ